MIWDFSNLLIGFCTDPFSGDVLTICEGEKVMQKNSLKLLIFSSDTLFFRWIFFSAHSEEVILMQLKKVCKSLC